MSLAQGPLFGWKWPELPAEFGPPNAAAGPTAIRAIAAVRAATLRIRMLIVTSFFAETESYLPTGISY